MINKIKILIIISLLSGHNVLSQNLPADTTFFIRSYDIQLRTSNEYKLYANVENQLTIRLLNINPGKIFIKPLIDSSIIKMTTTFFVNDGGWNFEIIEDARSKIPDDGLMKVELFPKQSGIIPFDINVIDSTNIIHFGHFTVEVIDLEDPILNISNLHNTEITKEELVKELKNVSVINLKEYNLATVLYGVKHMKITIYNKKGEIRYSGKTFGNIITTNIEKAILECKKKDKIVIQEIVSKGFNYEDITIQIKK